MPENEPPLPFQLLAAYADESEAAPPHLPPDPGRARRPGLADRLASATLSGVLPLGLLATLALWLCTRPLKADAALLLLPLLVWFFAPLVRTGQSVHPAKLVASAAPLFGACAAAGLGAAAFEHSLTGHPVHLEFLAQTLQDELQVLTPVRTALYGGAVALAVAMGPLLAQRYPWVDGPRSSRFSVRWRLAGILLAMLGLTWGLHALSADEEGEAEWKALAADRYAKRPLVGLPETAARNRWQAIPSGGDLVPALDRLVLEPHPVDSLAEWESAHQAMIMVSSSGSLEEQTLAMLAQGRLTLLALPDERADFRGMVNDFVVPYLAQEPLSVAQMERWLERVRALYSEIPTSEGIGDVTAYYALWQDPSELHSRRGFGWRVDHAYDTLRPGRTAPEWHYQGSFRPTPLRIFGREFSWSPTRLVDLALRRRLTRQWMQVRGEISPSDFRAYGWHKIHHERPIGGVEGKFWERMSRASSVGRDRHALRTAELVLELRLYQAERGRYPADLSELVDEVTYRDDFDREYSLNRVDGVTILRNEDTERNIKLLGGSAERG